MSEISKVTVDPIDERRFIVNIIVGDGASGVPNLHQVSSVGNTTSNVIIHAPAIEPNQSALLSQVIEYFNELKEYVDNYFGNSGENDAIQIEEEHYVSVKFDRHGGYIYGRINDPIQITDVIIDITNNKAFSIAKLYHQSDTPISFSSSDSINLTVLGSYKTSQVNEIILFNSGDGNILVRYLNDTEAIKDGLEIVGETELLTETTAEVRNYVYRLQGVLFETQVQSNITVLPKPENYQRTDIFVGKSNPANPTGGLGIVEYIAGIESESQVINPIIPPDAVLLSTMIRNVDGSIDIEIPEIDTSDFVLKSVLGNQTINSDLTIKPLGHTVGIAMPTYVDGNGLIILGRKDYINTYSSLIGLSDQWNKICTFSLATDGSARWAFRYIATDVNDSVLYMDAFCYVNVVGGNVAEYSFNLIGNILSAEAMAVNLEGVIEIYVRTNRSQSRNWQPLIISSFSKVEYHNLTEDLVDLPAGTNYPFKKPIAPVTISDVPPAISEEAHIWVDNVNWIAYIKYNDYWVEFPSGSGDGGGEESKQWVTIGLTPPENPEEGFIWIDSETFSTYVYFDDYWVEFGGFSTGGGSSDPEAPSFGRVIYSTPTLTSLTTGVIDAKWINFSGIVHTVATEPLTFLTSPSSGSFRYDLIQGHNDGTVSVKSGSEGSEIGVIMPTPDINTIMLSAILRTSEDEFVVVPPDPVENQVHFPPTRFTTRVMPNTTGKFAKMWEGDLRSIENYQFIVHFGNPVNAVTDTFGATGTLMVNWTCNEEGEVITSTVRIETLGMYVEEGEFCLAFIGSRATLYHKGSHYWSRVQYGFPFFNSSIRYEDILNNMPYDGLPEAILFNSVKSAGGTPLPYNLQQVTDVGNVTTIPITVGGITNNGGYLQTVSNWVMNGRGWVLNFPNDTHSSTSFVIKNTIAVNPGGMFMTERGSLIIRARGDSTTDYYILRLQGSSHSQATVFDVSNSGVTRVGLVGATEANLTLNIIGRIKHEPAIQLDESVTLGQLNSILDDFDGGSGDFVTLNTVQNILETKLFDKLVRVKELLYGGKADASISTTTVQSLNMATSPNLRRYVLSADLTINFSTNLTATDHAMFTFVFKQDGVGNWDVFWNTVGVSIVWQGGIVPVVAGNPDETTIITLIWDGYNYYGMKLCGFSFE